MLSVDESEIRELQWWHDHHKSNLVYLVRVLEQYFGGDEEVMPILKSALVGYSKLYTGVTESETEAETTD